MVNSPPGPAGTITGTSVVCQGDSGVVYSVSPVTNATAYIWNLSPGTEIISGLNTTSITVKFSETSQSGNFTVNPNNICGNGTSSPAFPVTVNLLPPPPSIVQQGDSLVSDAPAGNQWYGPNGMIGGATGTVFFPSANGIYYDIVTLSGCSSDLSNSVNFVQTGMSTILRSQIRIYPNPAVSNIHIEIFLDRPSGIIINLMNITGTNVKTVDLGNHSKGLTRCIIDCNDIREGIYFMKVTTSYDSFVQKVILKK
jgi:hypothetical protein